MLLPATVRTVYQTITDRMHLVRFTGFAAIAIVLNLLTQNTMLAALGGHELAVYAALIVGNGSGLVFKYIADKYWVFEDRSFSAEADSRKFALYASFGVLTTVVFWATELAFHYLFDSLVMTNVGGVIGLAAGYVLKYNLDKQVTFRASPVASSVQGKTASAPTPAFRAPSRACIIERTQAGAPQPLRRSAQRTM